MKNKDKYIMQGLLMELIGNYVGSVGGFAQQIDEDAVVRADHMIQNFNERANKLLKLIDKL